ncbi:MAG: peptidylprolyl isomerase [Opitutales bacterium]
MPPRTRRSLCPLGLWGLMALLLVATTGCRERNRPINRDIDRYRLPVVTSEVVMETTAGDIRLELFHNQSPKTVAQFLEYAEEDFYQGTLFHRVIDGFMIQGGGFTPELERKEPTKPNLPNEAFNGLKNTRGTIAVARTMEKDSGNAQFFINVSDNPNLDHGAVNFGYAVFGRVTSGMEVVDAISKIPTTTRKGLPEVPVEPVEILDVRKVDTTRRSPLDPPERR